MQLSLALDPDPLVAQVHKRLLAAFGSFAHSPRMEPVDQLIKSMISSRTYDEVSWAAYLRLEARYHPWTTLIEASPAEVRQTIATVTYAEEKAAWLPETLRKVWDRAGDLSLAFLAEGTVEAAHVWLRGLPGVGDKVAAAVLNFSTLGRPVMVVDTHVWRVARRIGLAPRNADPASVRQAIMAAAPLGWGADAFFDLHWLLKRLGQHLCQPHHTRCSACPLAGLCGERRRAVAQMARRDTAPLAFQRHENKT